MSRRWEGLSVPKEYRRHVRAALRQGWTLDLASGTGHPKLRSPTGAIVVMPGTSTNRNGPAVLASILRRYGVIVDDMDRARRSRPLPD